MLVYVCTLVAVLNAAEFTKSEPKQGMDESKMNEKSSGPAPVTSSPFVVVNGTQSSAAGAAYKMSTTTSSSPSDADLSANLNRLKSSPSAASVTLSRCPYSAANSGVYLFSDKKLCNVYHECNCSTTAITTNISAPVSLCTFVKTNVCPIGTVYLNATNKCEPIEIYGCETSYLQTINIAQYSQKNRKHHQQAHNNQTSKLEKDYEVNKRKGSAANDFPQYDAATIEPVNITGLSEFSCPPGANERFADPQVCNLFHVCVSRGEQTFDQPFLCPFSTIFRTIDASTMYCDKRNKNDCLGKAFYRSLDDDENTNIIDKSILIDTNMNSSQCVNTNEILEDKQYCNLYHLCRDGKEHVYMCENQLLFNPLSQICDYPINIVCYNKKIFKIKDNMGKKFFSHKLASSETKPAPVASPNSNLVVKNGTQVTVLGVKIELNCPVTIKNYIIPDKTYCNVYHNCRGHYGNLAVCDKGKVFDINANGPEAFGACNYEEMVNCAGKYILVENEQAVPGRSVLPKSQSRSTLPSTQQEVASPDTKLGNYINTNMGSGGMGASYIPQMVANSREELVSGIPFDCRGRPNGHWRDLRYCDVFHACISGEQKKTYSCAQLGERIYFDETTRRCEFTKNNPLGCQMNTYFQSLTMSQPKQSPIMPDEPAEAWKQFIRSREQFSCLGRMDGFYASRWCNVFYRCFLGSKNEFLCPKMLNQDRLWWVQHGSPQETPQTTAACVWPCETKKPCLSPGGSVVEVSPGKYEESVNEAERVWRSANCATTTNGGIDDIFKIIDKEFSCQGLAEGSFYPSKYCNVFHRCTNGKRKDFQCAKATNSPYDLWWNEETNQCDWPCKVTCNKAIYGASKTAYEIQNEDRSLNIEECRKVMKSLPLVTPNSILPVAVVSSKPIGGPLPDEYFVCRSVGLTISLKYCNVYYECKSFGQPPSEAFYCVDGNFDNNAKMCKPSNLVQCQYNPPLVFPFISIPELSPPEEVGCSNTIGYYIIHSNRYCNIYYTCDGRSSKPTAHRCYDRINLEDGIFNREKRRCESKLTTACEGEIFPIKIRYQSSPVDHTRLADLQPLTCRSDQQYLAEHDKYCNLYHSCILGKYQMYSCVTLGSFDKTSYFYYTNGDCSAPNEAQCGPNKSIYPYEKLFPNVEPTPPTVPKYNQQQSKYTPIVSPSVQYKGQATFGSVSLKNTLPYSPMCSLEREKYFIAHPKYCNIFYECYNGEMTTFACIDSSTGTFSGIFDENLKSCKPFNQVDCPYNSLYNPEDGELNKIDFEYNNNGANVNVEKVQPTVIEYPPFRTESNFSCVGKLNGYYESEWCNVFYRCINGKRIDAKCSSGGQSTNGFLQYDLWWEHQNQSYDPTNPIIFIGPDEDAKCEWPCKIKCDKQIWSETSKLLQSARQIFERDSEIHPDCTTNSLPTVAANTRNLIVNQPKTTINYQNQAFDTENLNPSGYYCEEDGIFRDPIYCNLFHICSGREKKTYQCKSVSDLGSVSIYDADKNACVSREEGFGKCNGVIFDPNFMNLPAYRDLPSPPRACLDSGIFRAYDNEIKYCDLYYWCEKSFSEPVYFYCDVASGNMYGKEMAYFNFDTKQCDMSSNVKCEAPYKVYASMSKNEQIDEDKEVQTSQTSVTKNDIQNFLQSSPYMMQIISGLLDPAPGYLSLPSTQFQTNFKCPLNSPGYYPNNEYCDIFHYCYNNGQFKTYVCASMQNQYQLWWSHQTEPGRRDNIFCDWPCNLVGPNTVCPANKRVLMRDRQQVSGGIGQQEVLGATCQNAPAAVTQQPAAYAPQNGYWKNEQRTTSSTTGPDPGAYMLNRDASAKSGSSATVTGYAPCTNSLEWYVSPQIIKCDSEYRVHGFAPDPKDCAKFYRCDQTAGSDGTSLGYLMSCVAGLWWDQSKRMCVLPSETSSCNPYKIINSQGNANLQNAGCRGLTCMQVGLTARNQMKNIPGKPNSFYKCEGQCAIEMSCPTDLIFDNKNQRCEWVSQQYRMASLLKVDEKLAKILQQHHLQFQTNKSDDDSSLLDLSYPTTNNNTVHLKNQPTKK